MAPVTTQFEDELRQVRALFEAVCKRASTLPPTCCEAQTLHQVAELLEITEGLLSEAPACAPDEAG